MLLWNSCTAIIGPKFLIGIITFPISNPPSTERERGQCRVQTDLSFDVEITIPFSLTKFSIDNEVVPIPLTLSGNFHFIFLTNKLSISPFT